LVYPAKAEDHNPFLSSEVTMLYIVNRKNVGLLFPTIGVFSSLENAEGGIKAYENQMMENPHFWLAAEPAEIKAISTSSRVVAEGLWIVHGCMGDYVITAHVVDTHYVTKP